MAAAREAAREREHLREDRRQVTLSAGAARLAQLDWHSSNNNSAGTAQLITQLG